MFRSYLKIAIRSLTRDKMYSLINLLGLTLGITCFIFISLFVKFELSYDQHHEGFNRIYRVLTKEKGIESSSEDIYTLSPVPLFTSMKQEFPEVEEITTMTVREATLAKEEELFLAKGLFTDENLFDIFTIKLLEGQGKKALRDKTSILLTQTTAKRIFGKESPIDKTILYNNENLLVVKGIVEDSPENQHFKYDFIVSRQLYPNWERDVNDWFTCEQRGYLLLKEGQDYKELNLKLKKYDRIMKRAYKNGGFSFFPTFSLQPIKDIHLHSNLEDELQANSSVTLIYFFSFIGIIILLLASMNYMNLAISRYTGKSKEVGIHKVLGAQRRNLLVKYVGESLVLSTVSFFIALLLVTLLLPSFNSLLGKNILISFPDDFWFFMSMLMSSIVLGFLSGIYPSLVLTKFDLIKSLKGNLLQIRGRYLSFRDALVIGQFIVAIGLMISSVVVYNQLDYFSKKELGYTKENILHLSYSNREIMLKENIIRNELLKHPNIDQVSISSQLPIKITSNGPVDNWEQNFEKKSMNFYRSYVDYDFMDLVDMKMIEGRTFSKDYLTDFTEGYIINETAMKKLGWSTAVGKEFFRGKVIGVVEDFHFQSLGFSIKPLFMTMRKGEDTYRGKILVKTKESDFVNMKLFIEKTMKSIMPSEYVEVQSLENTYNELYTSENKLGYVFNLFTFISMLIASMGLFGLVSFHVAKRTKEIAIRKVLGSPAFGIMWLVSKEFIKLILIALFIAVPIAYYSMSNWLQNYVYLIEMNVSIFLLVGSTVLLLSIITIWIKAYKVTISNPVKSIQTE